MKIRQQGSLSPTDGKKNGKERFLGLVFFLCEFPADIGHPSVEVAVVDIFTLDFPGDVNERVMKNFLGNLLIGDDPTNYSIECFGIFFYKDIRWSIYLLP